MPSAALLLAYRFALFYVRYGDELARAPARFFAVARTDSCSPETRRWPHSFVIRAAAVTLHSAIKRAKKPSRK